MGQVHSLGGRQISRSGNDDRVLARAQPVENCLAAHGRPRGEDRAVQMLQSHGRKAAEGRSALVANRYD